MSKLPEEEAIREEEEERERGGNERGVRVAREGKTWESNSQ